MRAWWVVGLVGCADGEVVGESAGDSGTEGPAICVDAPVVTWDNFGAGFVTQHCQSCHASTATDRNDAPETVVFDAEQDVLDQADRVLARAAGEAPTMPPQGGVTDDDRYRLEVWLTCP